MYRFCEAAWSLGPSLRNFHIDVDKASSLRQNVGSLAFRARQLGRKTSVNAHVSWQTLRLLVNLLGWTEEIVLLWFSVFMAACAEVCMCTCLLFYGCDGGRGSTAVIILLLSPSPLFASETKTKRTRPKAHKGDTERAERGRKRDGEKTR